MNIPSLPTDNLYKFLALTGVLLCIVSVLPVWSQAGRSQDLLREFKHQAALLKARLEIETLKSDLSQDARKRVEDSLIHLADLVPIEEELNLILKRKNWYLGLFALGELLGAALGFIGFSLWYTRVQKYQDILLAREAAAVNASPERSNGAS